MTVLMRLVSAVLLVLPALGGPPEDVADRLARLGDPSGVVRLEAQLWLGSNLEEEHLPLVAEAARTADGEIRRRLGQALGSEDRLLGLAVALATDADRDVAGVGRKGLEGLITRWSSSARDAPMRRWRLPGPWEDRELRKLSLDIGGASLDQAVSRLDRLGRAPVPMVLDPGLEPGVAPRADTEDAAAGLPERVSGSWVEILKKLVRKRRVSFEVLGYRGAYEDEAAQARPWIRVCVRGDEDSGNTASHVAGWCVGVVREYDPNWNESCARALGTLGWPAALRWLESRWSRESDPAALEGLLAAAERGRVSPVLARPDSIRLVLSSLDAKAAEDLEGARLHAERVARALGAIGPLGTGGELLSGAVLEGFGSATVLGRWARLVALELQGRAAPGAEALCRNLLVSTRAHASIRWQALRTLHRVASGESGPVTVNDLTGLLDFAAVRGEAAEAGWLIVAMNVQPVEGEVIPPGAGEEDRAGRVVWAVTRGDEELAFEFLRDAIEKGEQDQLGDGLRAWVGLGRRTDLVAWLDRAAERDPGLLESSGFLRLRVRSGCSVEADRLRWVGARGRRPSGAALLDVGELAGVPGLAGDNAREVLVDFIRAGRREPRLSGALERAIGGLRRRRADTLLEDFLSSLRVGAARSGHPLSSLFYDQDWPDSIAPPELRLETRDRGWRLP